MNEWMNERKENRVKENKERKKKREKERKEYLKSFEILDGKNFIQVILE